MSTMIFGSFEGETPGNSCVLKWNQDENGDVMADTPRFSMLLRLPVSF